MLHRIPADELGDLVPVSESISGSFSELHVFPTTYNFERRGKGSDQPKIQPWDWDITMACDRLKISTVSNAEGTNSLVQKQQNPEAHPQDCFLRIFGSVGDSTKYRSILRSYIQTLQRSDSQALTQVDILPGVLATSLLQAPIKIKGPEISEFTQQLGRGIEAFENSVPTGKKLKKALELLSQESSMPAIILEFSQTQTLKSQSLRDL